MCIGNNIRNLRELKNLTQSYVAAQLDMSVSGYGKIERDDTDLSIKRLHQIADVLKVETAKILDFEKNTVFNLYNNKNASGVVQNQQLNDPSELKGLLGQIIQDNQSFKNYLEQLLREKHQQ